MNDNEMAERGRRVSAARIMLDAEMTRFTAHVVGRNMGAIQASREQAHDYLDAWLDLAQEHLQKAMGQ